MFENHYALEMIMRIRQSQALADAAEIRLARAAKAGRRRSLAAVALARFGRVMAAAGLWLQSRFESVEKRGCQDCGEPLAS